MNSRGEEREKEKIGIWIQGHRQKGVMNTASKRQRERERKRERETHTHRGRDGKKPRRRQIVSERTHRPAETEIKKDQRKF